MSRQPFDIYGEAQKPTEPGASHLSIVAVIPIRPAKPLPLLNGYEILTLAHASIQSGSHRVSGEVCARAAQGFMSADIYGSIHNGVIEDMRVMVNGIDLHDALPDSILQEITSYIVDGDF